MALTIVRLGSPRAAGEGLRLGTVRRPPRGVRKAELAARDFYDLWFPTLAPSEELLRSSYPVADAAAWRRFERRYRAEMKAPAARHDIALLAKLSQQTDLSVGCYCADEARCHRSVLRELLDAAGAQWATPPGPVDVVPHTTSTATPSAADALAIRPVGPEHLEAFIAHCVEHDAESGRGGAPYFGPYDRDDPYPVERNRERLPVLWARSLDEPGWARVWGLFEGDRIVGSGSLHGGDMASALHRARLGMGIIAAYRGQGWGRRLLEAIIAWARAQPAIAWIDLGVIGDNEAAARLYPRLGFVPTAELPDRWRMDGGRFRERQMTLSVNDD